MSPEFEDCTAVLRALYAFHDNELSPADADEIREHLMACEHCLDDYDVEAALRLLIRRSCCESAPDTLRVRIQSIYTRTVVITEE